MKPLTMIHQGMKGVRLIENGKGDEQAHAGGVDGRGGDLQVPGQFHLALGLEGVHAAADAQEVGGHGVAGGVVGPHGGGGVGHADAL